MAGAVPFSKLRFVLGNSEFGGKLVFCIPTRIPGTLPTQFKTKASRLRCNGGESSEN